MRSALRTTGACLATLTASGYRKKSVLLLLLLLLFHLNTNAQTAGATLYPASSNYTASTTAGTYHQFYGEAGKSYRFSFCSYLGGSSTGDPTLKITDTSGNELAANDNAVGLASEVNWICKTTGYYRVVHENKDLTTGTARVLAYDMASLYPSTSNYTARGASGSMYRFYAEAGKNYRFSLCSYLGGSSSGDSELKLYNASGVEIASNDDAVGLTAEVNWICTTTGYYFVQQQGKEGTTGANVERTIAYDMPNLYPSGSNYTARGASGSIYKFYAEAGKNYRFSHCSYLGGASTGDSELKLYNSTGTVIASNDDAVGLSAELNWICTASGYYFVQQQGKSGTTGASAERTIAYDMPSVYPHTSTYTARGGSGSMYRFYGENGKTYKFSLCETMGGSSTGDSEMKIYNSQGAEVATNDDACGTASEITWTCTASGYYFVQQQGKSGTAGASAERLMAYKETTAVGEPIVSATTVANITGTSADWSSSATEDAGVAIIEKGFAYSTTSSSPSLSGSYVAYSSGGTGAYTISMISLVPNSTYYIRAYATTSAGTTYGEVQSFLTGGTASKPTVAATTVSNIMSTSAKWSSNITSDGGAVVTDKGFVYSSTTSTPDRTNSVFFSYGTGTGSLSYATTSLAANTTYYVRAYAVNSAGVNYGAVQTFTTPSAEVRATVSPTAVSSITAASATWNSNVTADGGAAVTEKGFVYDTYNNPDLLNNADTKIIIGTGGTGALTYYKTGLTPNTTYYVRAYAINSVGVGYGAVQSFTTAPVAATVSAIVTNSVSNTSADLGGIVGSDGGSAVTERGFVYNKTGSPTTSNSKVSASGTGTGYFSASLTGLTINTTYFVRAYAINAVGTSYGPQLTLTTTSVGLPDVTATTVSNITASTADWTASASATGGVPIIERGFTYNTSGNPTLSLDGGGGIGSGNGSFVWNKSHLAPSTTYYVRAYAKSSAGIAHGAEQSFTTPAAGLATVAATTVSDLTATSATWSSNVTSDGGTAITARGFVHNTTGSPTISDPQTNVSAGTGAFSGTRTGLVAGKRYYVRAYATNAAGTTYGTEIIFTTPGLPTVSAITITNVAASTATWNGEATATGGLAITEKGFVFSDIVTTPDVNGSSRVVEGAGDGAYSWNKVGLTPNTTYYIRVYAKSSAGIAYGAVNTFKTTSKETPAITWAAPAAITYGTALSTTQLNATAKDANGNTVAGTLAYYKNEGKTESASGAMLGVGTHTLYAVFTPNNTGNYNTAEKQVTITVNKATAAIALTNLSQFYNGTAKNATATTTPAGLAVNLVYKKNGVALAAAPVNAGVYTVEATITDANYAGTRTETFRIEKSIAALDLGNLFRMYDGTEKQVIPTTTPAGLNTIIVYKKDDVALAGKPVNAGTYNIVATINDDNYTATATGVLTIEKATQTVSFDMAVAYEYGYGDEFDPKATATSLGGITYTIIEGASFAEVTADNKIRIIGLGIFKVEAKQADNENYENATAIRQFKSSKATRFVNFPDQQITYSTEGYKLVPATATPAGAITYAVEEQETEAYTGKVSIAGDIVTTLKAGKVKLRALVADDMYGTDAFDEMELTIDKANAAIAIEHLEQEYDGTAKQITVTTTPADLPVTVTYNGSETLPTAAGTYTVVATVQHENYAGELTATLTISGVMAIGDAKEHLKLAYYPNPTERFLYLELQEDATVEIVSVTGQVLVREQAKAGETILDLSRLRSGQYILRVQTKQHSIQKHIIKR
ncbi:MBG domain-containing protein [Pontibacter sp. H249]|uniref:MBG domain-containing protein n=1 Tax=Pontibacter sp. H249 TaxID=3133420 RepID=UPI0030C1C94B